VVRLQDPSDPQRKIFRRILGREGDQIRYKAGNLSVNARGLRIREMSRSEGWVIRSEADAWLLRKRAGRDRSPSIDQAVQPGFAFLMADARDEAIDSRWWGGVPTDRVGKKVWLRWGVSDTWRKRLAFGGTDGPWPVPKPKAPSTEATSTGGF
jgi:signal peptidase I